MTPRPNVTGGLDIHETDDGLIVFDESTDRVHHLNNTASVILQLCDGTREVAEIAAEVAELFGLEEPPVAETELCIEDLEREHLLG